MPNNREGWVKPFKDRIKGKYVVTESGCWEWQRALNSEGYPVISSYGSNLRVHRLMMQGYGPMPKHLIVCHNCLNKRCINPEHLRLDTHRSNRRDADCAKLTVDQVEYIKTSSKTNRELADELPVGIRHIWGIRNGERWL